MRLPTLDLKTITIVTVLSALTWALAESQTLRTQALTLRVALEDGSTGPSERTLGPVVRVDPAQPWDGAAELALTGSAALIDGLADRLRGRAALVVGRELPTEPGTHTINLRDALRASEAFRASGVTIESVSPESVTIQVDQLETRELTIRVSLPDGVEPETTPAPRPASVILTAPAALLDALEPGATAVATVTPEQVEPLLPGRDETLTAVRVTPPASIAGAWAVRLDPARADVTIRLRSKSSSLTIPRLPVQLLIAPAEAGRWTVEVEPSDQDLIDVTLTGPQEQLDRIRRSEVRPMAFVSLTFEELEAGVASKRATIVGLPAGVRAQAAREDVRLSIRPAAEPVGPLGPEPEPAQP